MYPTHTNRAMPWKVKLSVRSEEGIMHLTTTATAPDLRTAEVFVRATAATEGWKVLRLTITPAQVIPVTDFI